MIVKYFATLRNLTEKQEEEIEASNVQELLDKLISKYGKSFEDQFFVNGELKKGVTILKNGRNVVHLSALTTPLSSSDTVSLFLPLAGG